MTTLPTLPTLPTLRTLPTVPTLLTLLALLALLTLLTLLALLALLVLRKFLLATYSTYCIDSNNYAYYACSTSTCMSTSQYAVRHRVAAHLASRVSRARREDTPP